MSGNKKRKATSEDNASRFNLHKILSADEVKNHNVEEAVSKSTKKRKEKGTNNVVSGEIAKKSCKSNTKNDAAESVSLKAPAKAKAKRKSSKPPSVEITSELQQQLGQKLKVNSYHDAAELLETNSEDVAYNVNDNELLMTTKARGSNPKKPAAPSEEVVMMAKKMSKQKKRRLESIRLRKEMQEKSAVYLATIAEHVIDDKQRELLVSGRKVGQTDTAKQLAQKLLKRYKAGLELTEEEHDYLFPAMDSNRFTAGSNITLDDVQDNRESVPVGVNSEPIDTAAAADRKDEDCSVPDTEGGREREGREWQ